MRIHPTCYLELPGSSDNSQMLWLGAPLCCCCCHSVGFSHLGPTELLLFCHYLYFISDVVAFSSNACLIRSVRELSLLDTRPSGPFSSQILLFSWHRHWMPQRSPKPARLGAGGRALQWGSNAFHQGTGAATRGRTPSSCFLYEAGWENKAHLVWCFSAVSEMSLSLFLVLSLPHPRPILCLPTSYFLEPFIVGQPPPNCSSPLVSWVAWWPPGQPSQDLDRESLQVCSPPQRISLSCLPPAGFRSLTNSVRGQFSLNIYLYLWVIAFSVAGFLTQFNCISVSACWADSCRQELGFSAALVPIYLLTFIKS